MGAKVLGGLTQLCSWITSHLLKTKLRRLLGFCLCCALILAFILKWKLSCIQPHTHIEHLCDSYNHGHTVGNLCRDLCLPESRSSLVCNDAVNHKEAVFSGTYKNYSAIFKSVKMVPIQTEIPTDMSYSELIKKFIKTKFNMSINDIDAKRMLYLQYDKNWPSKSQIENMQLLLQDNEYLALMLYERYDIFPKLLGTCGSTYAVQKLNSVSGFWQYVMIYDSKNEWIKRIKIALLIMDFLKHLESGLPEPLYICSIRLSNFGVTDDFKKIMYHNLDHVHPHSVINKITANGLKCKRHSDCDFLDCRSFCNLVTYRCQHGVVNNNLQIVCERIFLGWVMSGRVMLPGLLIGPHAPRVLVEILESCANPFSETGTPRAAATKDVRKRLYTLLAHLKVP